MTVVRYVASLTASVRQRNGSKLAGLNKIKFLKASFTYFLVYLRKCGEMLLIYY